ncbi:MAG: hypothetical protein VW779_02925 [Halieaceae bacterium]
MSTFTAAGRLYIAALTVLLGLLMWDISSRLADSRTIARQQYEAVFQKDATRREGMRDLLARDVQSATQLALYSLSELNQVDTDDARAGILKDAFSRIGFSLRNSRYDFFETYLVQETPDGQLLLRGRYPSEAALEGVSVANTPLFDHVDLAAVELFQSNNEIYQVEESSLLKIASPQPVLISTRLIFEDETGLSRWFMVHRVGIADTHRSIDLIGQQMVGGSTPMRIINIDARTGECQLAWDVAAGVLNCDDVDLQHSLSYRTEYDTEVTKALTYSIYQPNERYSAMRMPASESAPQWRTAIPLVLALFLLLTTAAYMRYRATSTDTLRSFADSLLVRDSVNSSIHDVLNRQLERMSQFAFAMRDGDIPESERRYFDIAISEFMQATLSLNTLRLESPPTSATQRPKIEKIDLKQLSSLGQMVLEVSTIDTPVDAKFLNSDDLPETILGYSHSVQTALVAAISLSAETTDDGRIEVSLWTEEVEGFECLNLRIIDSGVGWGLSFDQATADLPESDLSTARKALLACLSHSGTALILQDEADEQNEYHLRLCNGNPTV